VNLQLETRELAYPGLLKRGQSNYRVKILQEWLIINEYYLEPDGKFGPVTQGALQAATSYKQLTREAWKILTENMAQFVSIKPSDSSLAIVALNKALEAYELGVHEIPPNSGPWVRLFMKGEEGADMPWCAGYVSYCLHLANQCIKNPVENLIYSFSCDDFGEWAEKEGRLIKQPAPTIKIGDLFLVHRKDKDYTHMGFVFSDFNGIVQTVEGNTSLSGSREGTHVLRRMRGKSNLHFISMDNL